MAECSLNPVTCTPQTTESLPQKPPATPQTSACKYETAFLPHANLLDLDTPYIRARMEANSLMSIHSSKPQRQAFRVRVSKVAECRPAWVLSLTAELSEVHDRSLICESVCLYEVKRCQFSSSEHSNP